jgi:putative sigma-54 modulation protein
VQVKITAKHGHLNEDTQQLIREKAEKLLHHFQRLMMIEVVVDFKEAEMMVEFLVSAEHKHDFVAREKNHDVLIACDRVVEKLDGQVRKYKEKIQNHRRGGPSAGDVATEGMEEPKE